jgi:hypothetical protein
MDDILSDHRNPDHAPDPLQRFLKTRCPVFRANSDEEVYVLVDEMTKAEVLANIGLCRHERRTVRAAQLEMLARAKFGSSTPDTPAEEAQVNTQAERLKALRDQVPFAQ